LCGEFRNCDRSVYQSAKIRAEVELGSWVPIVSDPVSSSPSHGGGGILTNPIRKSRRGRYVEDQKYPVSTTQLKKWRLLREGVAISRSEDGVIYTCDLSGEQCWLRIDIPGHMTQTIALVSRRVGRGLRWFLVEGATGIVCETMYLFEGRWVSRQTAGFAYRSQSKGKLDRKLAVSKTTMQHILGTSAKGPARGRPRRVLRAKLERTNMELQNIRETLRSEAARILRRRRKVGLSKLPK
jgi:hypothetical protein